MRKGSITVYLSLSLLVLLSLITTGLYSARQAAGRVLLASGTEQALFSVFGQYDRDLFDAYGLLFLDGGYGNGSLLPGRLMNEIEQEAKYVLEPGKALIGLAGKDPVGLRLQDNKDTITGYVLATDDGGRAFRRQICEIMEKKLGPAGLVFLEQRLNENRQVLQEQQEEYETYREEDAERYYQEDRAMFGERVIPMTETETEDGTVTEIDTSGLPDVGNPIETIRNIQAAGILSAVRPWAWDISSASMEGTPVSRRSLASGMSMAADGWEGRGEKLLLQEYLAEYFPCYSSDEKGSGLRYQIEYAVGGRMTDRENLQEVLMQLLVVREAVNFLYLMKDPASRAQADTMANILSLIILAPEAAPVISFTLKAVWAYGESVLDLRNLLDGKKVPLIKDASSWQIPLYGLIFLRVFGDSYRHTDENGLEYKDYLRLLLLPKSADSLSASLMDLVEMNVRTKKNRPDFRLDVCLDAIRVELHASVGRNEYRIERSYGYNM